MRGRKPKPTKLKLIEGNRGHRPLPGNEPVPAAKIPKCPVHLDKIARREWRNMARQLEPLGLLTELDATVFAIYCQAYSTWTQAEDKIREMGMVRVTPNGFTEQNPYFPIANKAKEQMLKCLVEMGMTPSSRSRVKVEPRETKQENKKERFFK